MSEEKAEEVRRQLAAAHAEAMRVGDSPLRADRAAESIEKLRSEVAAAGLSEERASRLLRCIDDALRVLRRDDDGREAARHLQTGMRQLEPSAPRPSPFLDD